MGKVFWWSSQLDGKWLPAETTPEHSQDLASQGSKEEEQFSDTEDILGSWPPRASYEVYIYCKG